MAIPIARHKGDMAKKSGHANKPPASLWLYGRHAVAAAIANPDRKVHRVMATKNALDWLNARAINPHAIAKLEDVKPDAIDGALPKGSVHQGLAAEVADLPSAGLKEACAEPEDGARVVILDQITDPQNIGAIFRSAAAFGARAIIAQDRRTPPLSGALAKAAAGAVETVPCVHVVNIARAIEGLQAMGYHCAGLAGDSPHDIAELPKNYPLAIVMGAEGAGLRQLVKQTCDAQYRIPISAEIESLNVATATAIALYAAKPKP